MSGYKTRGEKRKYERLKRRSILHLNKKIALLEDISEEGILVSSQEVPPSQEVSISMRLLDSEFKIEGMIRWKSVKDDFSGLFSIGIELINPSNKFRKLIRENMKKPNGDGI